ncbi:hypothetical protein BFR06_11840 [Burkholderia pseudomallei]|nr:hypothetical protein BFR05_11835 [Burkholderia pseudomallei]APF98486.1 hypothetical protein BFR06_11840 [Burkholderia pseudomallei]OMZ13029.1 hypothetical protein AQ857_03995 [Burkholderia pseudomallei]OMZ16322.1 hypothetical protein AQ858_04120 [Burkholderia pseudomallei]ONB66068.1 hypothetical protein AQ905_20150 [Burkholderia pseudomallei]
MDGVSIAIAPVIAARSIAPRCRLSRIGGGQRTASAKRFSVAQSGRIALVACRDQFRIVALARLCRCVGLRPSCAKGRHTFLRIPLAGTRTRSAVALDHPFAVAMRAFRRMGRCVGLRGLRGGVGYGKEHKISP